MKKLIEQGYMWWFPLVTLIVVGLIQIGVHISDWEYQWYQENGVRVAVTVTDVKAVDNDNGGYDYKFYGSFSLDGVDYSDVYMTEWPHEDHWPIGFQVSYLVDPEKPDRMRREEPTSDMKSHLMVSIGIVVASVFVAYLPVKVFNIGIKQ